MNNKFIIILTIFFLPLTTLAERTPNEEKTVVGYADHNGQLYNITHIYGNTIHYTVQDPNITINTINSSGERIYVSFNYSDYIREAFNEWAPAGISVQQVPGAGAEARVVSFSTSNYADNSLGSTIFDPSGNSRLRIDVGSFNKIIMNNFEKLKSRKAIPENMSPEEYIKLKLKITIKHEIGHVLGLLHNNESGAYFPYGVGQEIARCRLLNQAPSIMLNGSNYDYIDRLAYYLGRPVTESDIGPSRNDIEGVRVMRRGGSWSSLTNRFSCLGLGLALSRSGGDL
ncbi:TPA: hypothetical protein NOY28_004356 [Escherichia coli]|uniref:hypothetical protein n=1 Tax=Escherichia coli TaxID=562 RepID=UPI001480F816|nr:hypothetical protein [Escherichia coli]MDA6327183.1 hypothetical protein [Escherichia coli]HAW5315013.1 hypothetical protein [Escherichia coli]HBN0662740.1 hypothetical protein [Escherichia coli]HBN0695202.1 hypothetical protein [Escherichia coli]HBN0776768.1 hypothetical protein [Escherichia coli]